MAEMNQVTLSELEEFIQFKTEPCLYIVFLFRGAITEMLLMLPC